VRYVCYYLSSIAIVYLSLICTYVYCHLCIMYSICRAISGAASNSSDDDDDDSVSE